jgi:hypothetical protein
MSENPPFPTIKRSACDRCRLQKLRCLPREPETDACARCKRLGAKCTTSYPRPAGGTGATSRAASRSLANTGVQQPLSLNWFPSLANANFPASEPQTSSTTWISSAHGRSASSSNIPESTLLSQSSPTTLLNPFDPLRFTLSDDYWSVFTDDFIFPNRGPIDDLMDFDLDQSTNNIDATTGIEDVEGSGDSRPRLDGVAQSSLPSSGQLLGGDKRLSQLNLDLAMQLQDKFGNSCSTLPGNDPSINGESDLLDQSKLLNDALGYSSEFLSIIQSYAIRRGENPDAVGNASSGTPNTPRAGIVVTLNVVSAYLQLVAVYTRLFRDLNDQLSDASTGIITTLNGQPTLQLTGLNVSNGSLQSKVVVHAILHQFESMERLLALPVEFRVTEKQDEYHDGMLEGTYYHSLLQAIANGNSTKAQGDEIDALSVDDGDIRALPTLKSTLQRVRMILSM